MRAIIICTLVLLAGCVNNHQKFYQEITSINDVVEPEKAQPQVLFTTREKAMEDAQNWYAKGYVPLGYTAFNGPSGTLDDVRAQARRVGASIVLVTSDFTGTRTSSGVIPVPTTTTTNHSFNNHSTIYGTGGSVQIFGNTTGSSTTHGQTYVPFTNQVDRYDQTSLYLVKSNIKYRFGLRFGDLTSADRSALKRNTGVKVGVVIERTPAFYANVLPGDVIVRVDDQDVRDQAHAMQLMNDVPVNRVSSVLTILRDGQERDIEVKLIE